MSPSMDLSAMLSFRVVDCETLVGSSCILPEIGIF